MGTPGFLLAHALLMLGDRDSVGLARRTKFFVASVEDARPIDELLVLFREFPFAAMKGRAVGLQRLLDGRQRRPGFLQFGLLLFDYLFVTFQRSLGLPSGFRLGRGFSA